MSVPNTPPAASPGTCPRCGQSNRCAMAAGEPAESCWCMAQAPALPAAHATPLSADAVCYCRDCLRALRNATTPA